MHLSALRHRATKLLVELNNDTSCIVVMKQMMLHTNERYQYTRSRLS
jgi:hypothetical protein